MSAARGLRMTPDNDAGTVEQTEAMRIHQDAVAALQFAARRMEDLGHENYAVAYAVDAEKLGQRAVRHVRRIGSGRV